MSAVSQHVEPFIIYPSFLRRVLVIALTVLVLCLMYWQEVHFLIYFVAVIIAIMELYREYNLPNKFILKPLGGLHWQIEKAGNAELCLLSLESIIGRQFILLRWEDKRTSSFLILTDNMDISEFKRLKRLLVINRH